MTLRFKLDENLPRRVLLALRDLGHDTETAESEGLAGAADPRLLEACVAENRILVTLDLDFADIRTYPPESHQGIWVLRPREQSFASILQLVLGGVRLSATEPAAGLLWTIDDQRVRIRG